MTFYIFGFFLNADVVIIPCFPWQFPQLYQEGVQNVLFSWRRILSWMLNGFCSAIIIFFFCTKALELQAFNNDGQTAGRDILGATMYTCIVWVVNLQMALTISYFTLVQHVVIWGSIAIYYLFLLAYGAISSSISTTAYKLFIEDLAPAYSYWLVTLVVVIATLIPYFSCSAVQMRFFPMYHEMIQWMRHNGQSNDPEFCDMVRQSSLRATTVGSTARLAARTKRSKHKNSNHRWYLWICSLMVSCQKMPVGIIWWTFEIWPVDMTQSDMSYLLVLLGLEVRPRDYRCKMTVYSSMTHL